MDTYKLAFPLCVSTALRRGFAEKLVKEGRRSLALTLEHVQVATETDFGRLLGVLSRQRRLAKITFERMTFSSFKAQLLIAFMSRYASIEVVFDRCAFIDYQRYATTPSRPCSRVTFTNCNIHPDHCRDFIATTCPHARFEMTRADRSLDAYLLTGATV